MAVSPNSRPVAQRAIDRLAQADPHVLGCMVSIDVQIAGASNCQVHQGMTSEQIEHVIKKPDPGRNLSPALTIEVEPQSDIGLTRLSLDLANSVGNITQGW